MDTRKFTGKLSAIAISILLASCGGGGDGYFGKTDSTSGGGGTTTTPQPVATNYHIVISTNKPSIVISGNDTAIITVKLVDVNGGGVVDQNVTLAIDNTLTNGVTIAGPSLLKTDASGNASFTINLDVTNIKDKQQLLTNGIKLNASFTDETKKVTSQTSVIQAVESLTSESSTAKYFLTMNSNKPTLVVTGDSAKITVKAVDKNGGGVAGQNIVLAIQDTQKNGVTIDGASTAVTDSLGNASFNITLPSSVGAIATDLIANGITVNANLTDANGITSKQSTKLNVSAAAIAQPVGNITFGNSSELQKSPDANYYSEALSAHVVDIDGKPIANQTVTLTLKMLNAGQGGYYLKADLEKAKQADILTLKQWSLSETDTTKKAKIDAVVEALNTYEVPSRDRSYCSLTDLSSTQLATGFVSNDGAINSTFTYTTDSTGKFDFRVNYLRRYASWQSVQITANISVSGKSLQSSMNYGLGYLKTDFDSESSQPFDNSPYGLGTCSYSVPWQSLVNSL